MDTREELDWFQGTTIANLNLRILLIEGVFTIVLVAILSYLSFPALLIISIVALFLGLFFYIEIIHRPSKVFIGHEGMVLFFFFTKPMKVQFTQIEGMTTDMERLYDGGLKVEGRWGYHVRPEVCKEIAKEYRSSQGKEPPTWHSRIS
jgi:hypothetical protein